MKPTIELKLQPSKVQPKITNTTTLNVSGLDNVIQQTSTTLYELQNNLTSTNILIQSSILESTEIESIATEQLPQRTRQFKNGTDIVVTTITDTPVFEITYGTTKFINTGGGFETMLTQTIQTSLVPTIFKESASIGDDISIKTTFYVTFTSELAGNNTSLIKTDSNKVKTVVTNNQIIKLVPSTNKDRKINNNSVTETKLTSAQVYQLEIDLNNYTTEFRSSVTTVEPILIQTNIQFEHAQHVDNNTDAIQTTVTIDLKQIIPTLQTDFTLIETNTLVERQQSSIYEILQHEINDDILMTKILKKIHSLFNMSTSEQSIQQILLIPTKIEIISDIDVTTVNDEIRRKNTSKITVKGETVTLDHYEDVSSYLTSIDLRMPITTETKSEFETVLSETTIRVPIYESNIPTNRTCELSTATVAYTDCSIDTVHLYRTTTVSEIIIITTTIYIPPP